MDPFAIALGVSSLALSLYGGSRSSAGASQVYQAQQQQIGLEQKVQDQKKQQMELDARRQQMQVLRNQQRNRYLALNNATSQGAQFGSGLQGGYGQISGQAGNDLLGINQNLEIGRNIFGINSQISQSRISQSQGQSQMATGAAFSGLGSQLLSATPSLSSIGRNATQSGYQGQSYGPVPGFGAGRGFN